MAMIQVQGKLSVETNNTGLNAWLILDKSEEGKIWKSSDVLSLLKEKNITFGYRPDDIDFVLKKLLEQKESPSKKMVAKGIPAKSGQPEKTEWNKFEIPAALEEDASKVYESAPDPEISRKTLLRKEIEKVVPKKGNLPFMNTRDEKVTEIINEEKVEKIVVDTTVLLKGFINEGEVIGQINSSIEGKNGQNVFGEPVAPEMPAAKVYYPGININKNSNSYTAGTSGFLRIGSNWLDILPFRNHEYSVYISEDKVSCFLDFNPGDINCSLPSIDKIKEELRDAGYPAEYLYDDEEMTDLIKNIIRRQRPKSAVPLCVNENCSVIVNINSEKTKATLNLKKGRGNGKPLILNQIIQFIKKYNFSNVDWEKIQKELQSFYHSKDLELLNYTICEGQSSKRGSDRKVTETYNSLAEETVLTLKKHISDSLKVDQDIIKKYPTLKKYDIDSILRFAYVQKDQEIATISAAEKGEDGKDIFGTKIEGIIGNDPFISILENILVSGNSIKTNLTGLLEMGEKDGNRYYRVREHHNAALKINFQDDKMKGFVSISKEYGTGLPFSLEKLVRELKTSGLKKGLKKDRVVDIYKKYKKGFPVENEMIAVGKMPSDNIESRIKINHNIPVNKFLDGLNNGKINVTVKKGHKIAELFDLGENPIDGYDVSGKVIPSSGVFDFDFKIGNNIKIEKSGKVTQLIALKNGELHFLENEFYINDKKIIHSDITRVNKNVKFPGNLIINGNVENDAVVSSGNNIQIEGYVSSSMVSADGTIVIKKGIKGRGKGILKCGDRLILNYIEHANVFAVGDINLTSSCLGSTVKSNGFFKVESQKGRIIGGLIKVKKGLKVSHVGSEKNTPTFISFGQDYVVEGKIEQEESNIKRINEQIAELDMLMNQFEREGSRKKLQKVRHKKLELIRMTEEKNLKLFNLRERFEEHFSSEIIITGFLYPGVIIESHGRTYEAEKKMKNLLIYFDPSKGKIMLKENK